MSRYLAISLPLHLVWEFAHMPLYGVWKAGTAEEIIYNGLHCTVGDVMIAAFSLLAAIVLVGWSGWPRNGWLVVSSTAILVGVGYTAFSEWHNVYVLQSWSYASAMPVVPGTGIGVSPLAQWLVVPTAALWLTWRIVRQ